HLFVPFLPYFSTFSLSFQEAKLLNVIDLSVRPSNFFFGILTWRFRINHQAWV
ncbi:hypothetical protein C0J52_14269, partial [Blattella germanica]